MATESNATTSSTLASSTPASSTPPPGETAASWASVQAGQAKLQEMLKAPAQKGLGSPPPPAVKTVLAPPVTPELKQAREAEAKAKKGAEAARVAKLTAEEKRVEAVEARRMEITKALTASDSKLTDAERTNLTSELRRLIAGRVTQAEREAMMENVTIDEWRGTLGLRIGNRHRG